MASSIKVSSRYAIGQTLQSYQFLSPASTPELQQKPNLPTSYLPYITSRMAPSPTTKDQTSPLLAPKLANNQPITPLSQTTKTSLNTLAILRMILGASTLIAPRWTMSLFLLSSPQSASAIARLFAIRDFVLGELLYTAENKHAADGGRREMKRALWRNIVSDATDICSIGFAVATGSMERLPAALLSSGAATGVVLGTLALRGM